MKRIIIIILTLLLLSNLPACYKKDRVDFNEAQDNKDALTYYLFLMNMEVVDGLSIDLPEGMSYTDIKNIYDRAMENNLLNETSVLDQSPVSEIAFNEYENRIYLDTDAMTESLDSEGFVQFLKDRKVLPFADRGGGIIPSSEPFEFGGAKSLIHMFRATFLDWDFISASGGTASNPIKLLSSDGKNTFSGIGTNLAISSASKNKDLAWRFLEFLISEKQYELQEKQSSNYFENFPYYYAMPINRKNFMKLADYFAKGDREFISSMDAINRSFNKKSFYDVQLDMALSHILEDYNKDLISAEECARQMQDRAYIFFNE